MNAAVAFRAGGTVCKRGFKGSMARAHCDLLLRYPDVRNPAWGTHGSNERRSVACSTHSHDAAAAQHGGPLHCHQLDQLAQPQEQWPGMGRLPGEAINRQRIQLASESTVDEVLETHML